MKKLLFIIFIVFFSCKEKKETIYSEDLNLLKNKIDIKFDPIWVKWSLNNQSDYENRMLEGPVDYQIKAIVKLTKQDWEELYKYQSNQQVLDEDIYLPNSFIENNWFTNPVKNSFYEDDGLLKMTNKVYSSDYFNKSPFINGFCFFANDNEVFIYMYTM